MSDLTSQRQCYCGSELPFLQCCQPLHNGSVQADSPERLMRSRYSAFVLALADYLLATWHPRTRPATLDLSDNPQWIKLQVVSASQSSTTGKVHFRAFYREQGEVGLMEEHSEFVNHEGAWYYLKGDIR